MIIVSIKRRNAIVRFFSINHYRVGVEDNGEVEYYNVWAGINKYSKDSFMWDLKNKINESNERTEFKELIGKEI